MTRHLHGTGGSLGRPGGAGAVLALCAGLFLLSACTVGPDFRPPETTLPSAWHGASGPGEASATLREPAQIADWWKALNDPVLTPLVEGAIAGNLDLRQATARIRQARAERGVGAAALWPTVGSSSAYTRAGSGSSRNTSGGSSGGSNLFQAGLDSAWELDIFGGTRRTVEALEANVQSAIEDRRDVLVTLVSEVGLTYVDLRGLQRQIAIARRNLQSQRHSADITRKRYLAGFASELDAATANAQAATTSAQIPLLEALARKDIYSLAVLLGREPTALLSELTPEGPIPLPPSAVPVGLPSELLRRRPDIRRAEADLHGATARIGVAVADLFPKFSLTGSASLASTSLASFASFGSGLWSLGPSVTWPVFDAGRIRYNIEAKGAQEEQALIAYQKAVLTALQEVETALTAFANEQERAKRLAEAVAQNTRAVKLSTDLYVAGNINFLDVLVTQRDLLSTEDALAQSTRTVTTQLITLYKALGGGWEEPQDGAVAPVAAN